MNSPVFAIGGNDFPMQESLKQNHWYRTQCIHEKNLLVRYNYSFNEEYCIAFEGSLYGKEILLSKIRQQGYTLDGKNDAALALHAYIIWGENCFVQLNGSWSFVIYDAKKNILFGSRDRFGLKPLFYVQNKNWMAFASEENDLLDLPGLTYTINPDAIQNHILWKDNSSDNRFINEISELLPSHYFVFNLLSAKLSVKKYYEIVYSTKITRYSEKEKEQYIGQLRELLLETIGQILPENEKMAFCLSGGIDSSSLVSMAATVRNRKNVIPLSSVSGYAHSDEYQWAKQVSDHYQLSGEAFFIDEKMIWDAFPELIRADNRPVTGTSTTVLLLLMKKAKELKCSTIYDGQGGDELFAGYSALYPSYLSELARKYPDDFLRELKYVSAYGGYSRLVKTIGKDFQTRCFPDMLSRSLLLRYHPEFSLLTKDFLSATKAYLWQNAPLLKGNLNRLLSEYVCGDWMNTLVHWEDRISKSVGIMARVPLMENLELIEYALSIPSCYKMHRGVSKWIFRESMKGIVPQPVLDRKDKMGFPSPAVDWVIRLNPLIREYIAEVQDELNIMDKNLLLKQWDSIFSKRDERKILLIWRYFTFLRWKSMVFGV